MAENVFAYRAYKSYLLAKTGDRSSRRGVKAGLAKALSCQPTYISQVLNGSAHLSLEQADAANRFFVHGKDETRFFLLLVQKDRAGTTSLRRHFQEEIDRELKKRLVLTERLGKQRVLGEKEQGIYYSSWHYAALHIALTVPELRDPETLAKYFRLPLKRVREALEFLVSVGLARSTAEGFVPGAHFIRLGNESPNILKHHANWRMQAIDSLEREDITDLHYSAVVSLSKEDVARIKDQLLKSIEESVKTIRDSNEEEVYALALDFFSLHK